MKRTTVAIVGVFFSIAFFLNAALCSAAEGSSETVEARLKLFEPKLKNESVANIYHFADDLFDQEDYYNALTMYQYVLTRNKDAVVEETLRFKMALCYEMGERWGEAEKAFSEFMMRYPDSQKSPEASYRIGQGYFRSGDFLKAANFFSETTKNYEKSSHAPPAQFALGLSRLKLGQWDLTKKEMDQFVETFPEHSLAEKARIVAAAAEKSDEIPQKSPALAGTLSIIPGLGKAYTHHWGGAVIALLINGGLGFVIYDSFDNDRIAVGAVFSTLAAATYSANILGGYRSAKRYNQMRQDEYAGEVMQKGYSPELELVK